MPIGLSHGDPCSRCPESRPGEPVRAAQHFGVCLLCWAGMSERQRRAAEFEAGPDDSQSLHARFEAYYKATRGEAA